MAIKQQNTTPFDSDAQRFILAAGLTRQVDKRAINYLVQGLKSNSLWTKMIAVYPFVGGNAYSCKFNLLNPRDSILGFALTFVASPTITSHGVDWNGTTQYADTNLNHNTYCSLNSMHMSYYSRENVAGAFIDMGIAFTTPVLTITTLAITSTNYSVNSGTSTAISNADTRGFYIATRTASNAVAYYRNGISGNTNASLSSALINANIYIGARNLNGAAATFTSRECAFASIGTAITAADAFVFNEIVQQFQIILNRAV